MPASKLSNSKKPYSSLVVVNSIVSVLSLRICTDTDAIGSPELSFINPKILHLLSGVGVGVNTGVTAGVGVGVSTGVIAGVGVSTGVIAGGGVGVCVGFGVGVGIDVLVAVAMGVGLGLGEIIFTFTFIIFVSPSFNFIVLRYPLEKPLLAFIFNFTRYLDAFKSLNSKKPYLLLVASSSKVDFSLRSSISADSTGFPYVSFTNPYILAYGVGVTVGVTVGVGVKDIVGVGDDSGVAPGVGVSAGVDVITGITVGVGNDVGVDDAGADSVVKLHE